MLRLAFPALVLSLIVTTALVWRLRRRFAVAEQAHALLQSATDAQATPLVPRQPLRPLLDQPDRAEGWILTTPDGACTFMSDGARHLLGLHDEQTSVPSLSSVITGLDVESMMLELRDHALAPGRQVHAAGQPSHPLELAGVGLRDRAGNAWGSALLISPWPSGRLP